MRETIWREPAPVSFSDELLKLAGGSRVAAAALAARGFGTPEQASAFIDYTRYSLSDPDDLPGMDAAAGRIVTAVRKGGRIAVWGDFDVDGQTSTAILTGGLRRLGADVIFHIPVRAEESHGVNTAGLQDLIHQGAGLVVTCDTGVGDHSAAEYCRQAGVDYIITDHHSLPAQLPPALVVVNPRRLPTGHPAAPLSGAGCAFFVLLETARRMGRPEVAREFVDLAALGLVADLVELTGDCRALVQNGLAQIRTKKRTALAAMAASAGLDLGQTTEDHISFIFAPRLNALGRLGDANEIVDFFLSDDPVQAGVTAARLDGLNLRRKMLTDQVYAAAAGQVEAGRLDREHAALVLHHPEWPAGVLGIAASRLVETYHLPAILLSSAGDGLARGSARSVEGVDITAAISACQDLLSSFGGHPMAGGLSLPSENIPAFRSEIERVILSGQVGSPAPLVLPLEARLSLPEVTLDLARQIEILAPFGPGNPSLLFTSSGLSVVSKKTLGRPGDHLQVTLADEAGNRMKAVWWNGSGKPIPQGKFDLAYHIGASSFYGEPEVQVEWTDWRAAAAGMGETSAAVQQRRWFDIRACEDPAAQLKKITASVRLLVWQEGANLSPLEGVNRYEITPAGTLAVWTAPSSWEELRRILESSSPEKVYLFSRPAEPSRPADLLKRVLGLIQYAVEKYDGFITIENLAALTALPETVVQLAVDLILSRSLFVLAASAGGRLKFARGGGRPPFGAELEEDFLRAVAEVNAFRKLFRQAGLDEIIRNTA